MKRILMVVTVALVMAALMVATAIPAFAIQPHHGCDNRGDTCFHSDVGGGSGGSNGGGNNRPPGHHPSPNKPPF